MKVVTAGALLIAAIGVGLGSVAGFNYVEKLGYGRGVKSSPPTNCYPFVKETQEQADNKAEVMVHYAGQLAYQQGVADAVASVKEYILDSCLNKKDLTVDGENFICLKKQEM